ncbi:MAG: LapA family protein [Chitinophagales bacterium]
MKRTYIAIIFILVLALIFAFQNTDPISLKFLAWQINGSQALIILSIFFIGYLGGWLLGMSSLWRKNRELRDLKKQSAMSQATAADSAADITKIN